MVINPRDYLMHLRLWNQVDYQKESISFFKCLLLLRIEGKILKDF